MKRMQKWMALFLTCLMVLGVMSPGLAAGTDLTSLLNRLKNESTEEMQAPPPAQEETPALAEETSAPAEEEPAENAEEDASSAGQEEVTGITDKAAFTPGLYYAEAGTIVYSNTGLSTRKGTITARGVVYGVSLTNTSVRVAFVYSGNVVEGYVSQNALSALSRTEQLTYALTATGGKSVYGSKLTAISYNPASIVIRTATPKPTATPKVTVTPKVTATPKATATPEPQAELPVIVAQPASVSTSAGKTAIFTVQATGVQNYLWEYSSDGGASWNELTNAIVWAGYKTARLSFTAMERYDGMLFRCRLTNEAGTVYTNAVTLNLGGQSQTAPVISAQPESQSVQANETVTLSVTASGATKYAWQSSPDNLVWGNLTDNGTWSGTSTDQLSFTADTSMNGFFFRCAVSNTAGTVYSDSAVLTVKAATKPVISVQPVSQTAAPDSDVTFTLSASGAERYQWQYYQAGGSWKNLTNGDFWRGNQTDTLTFAATTYYAQFLYRCAVSNSVGTVYSTAVSLTVSSSATAAPTATPTAAPTATPTTTVLVPVFNTQPQNVQAQVGSKVTFSAQVTGATAYQWQYSTNRLSWVALSEGASWSGVKTNALSFTASDGLNGYYFRLRTSNVYGIVYSSSVRLTVITASSPTATPAASTWRAAPTNVRAALSPDGTKAVITWTGNDLCTGYAIYEQQANGYKVLGTVNGANVNTFTTKALTAGTHTFYVKARSGSAVGYASETVTLTIPGTATPTAAPTATPAASTWRAAPTNVRAALSQDGTKAVITWSGNSLCTGYAIYEQQANGYKVLGTVSGANVNTFTTKALTAGTHTFYVKARSGSAVGYASATVSLTIPDTASPTATPTAKPTVTPTATPTAKPTATPTPVVSRTAPVFSVNNDVAMPVTAGMSVVLDPGAVGATSYQWQVNPGLGFWTKANNSTLFTGTTTGVLTVNLTSGMMSYQFRLLATNAYGTSTSPVYSFVELVDPPANIRATSVTRNSVTLTWSASASSRVKSYKVYYGTSASVNDAQVVTVSGTSVDLTGLTASTKYYIWVQAVGSAVSSELTDEARITVTTKQPAALPGAPTGVKLSAGATTMSVTWNKPANSEVDGYIVYYRPTSASAASSLTVSGGDTLSCTLSGLTRSTSYRVWVAAYNDTGTGASSTAVTVTTQAKDAAPEQPLSVTAASAGATSVKVTWKASPSAGVKGYYIYYGTSTAVSNAKRFGTAYSSSTLTGTVTGLNPGTTYYFWVTAYNAEGTESTMDANVRATAKPTSASSSNKVSAEEFSRAGDKYLGTSYGVYDCQAFVERMLWDVGIKVDLAGSNAWYRTMTWRGTPEQCIATFGRIPTGAFLFIHAYDGGEPSYYHDSMGNASHIGVVTHRNDGAIHSSYSRGKVCTSVFNDATVPNGGWNCVGLWIRLDYGDDINEKLAQFAK